MTREATTVDLDNVTTNFTNITEEPPKDINRTEFIILTSIVAPLSFFGNLLILICFVKEKKLRFFGNYFVISLATTDMISGVVVAGKKSNFITSTKSEYLVRALVCRTLWHAFHSLQSSQFKVGKKRFQGVSRGSQVLYPLLNNVGCAVIGN